MEKNEGIEIEMKGRNGTVELPTRIIDHLKLNAGDWVSFEVLDVNTVVLSKWYRE